ncbi:MAG: hypothetical protein JXA95_05410 [Spirochaetales bacterium]|nr:hypothetical protein [Spirochaetales bacterium]
MKHSVSTIAISVLFPLLLAAVPSDLTFETRDMLEKLSLSYMENRVLAFRSNIAVGDILSTGEDREMMEIAEAIRDPVMMQLEESTIQLTLRLTDVETGETYTRMASVSRTQLEATRETVLDMSFVQKMGIGLSLISGGTNALA